MLLKNTQRYFYIYSCLHVYIHTYKHDQACPFANIPCRPSDLCIWLCGSALRSLQINCMGRDKFKKKPTSGKLIGRAPERLLLGGKHPKNLLNKRGMAA